MRSSITCLNCSLVQFKRSNCRRCRKTLLSPPDTSNQNRVLPNPCGIGFGGVLPDIGEVERQLIWEALRRAEGDAVVAAKTVGIGKTTIYRKIREIMAMLEATNAL